MESLTHVFNNYDEKTVNKICLIKTLDRLDNLKAIHVFDEDKQRRIRDNTIRDILPLAIDLNIGVHIKQINDICNNKLLNEEFNEHRLYPHKFYSIIPKDPLCLSKFANPLLK